MPTKSKRTTAVPPPVAQSIKQASALWEIPTATLRLAKSAGCPAFIQHRVHREPLIAWLKENPEITAEGEKVSTEAELKREGRRLTNELLQVKLDRERGETILRTTAANSWARACAIVQEEARMLMERDAYRVFIDRITAKIGVMEFEE